MREKVTLTPMQTLTPREIKVLEMLGSGLGNKAIAPAFAYLQSHRQVSCLIHFWQEPGFRVAPYW